MKRQTARPPGGLKYFERRTRDLAALDRMSRPPPPLGPDDALVVVTMASNAHIRLALTLDRVETLRCIFTHYYRATRPASDVYAFLRHAVAEHSRAAALTLIALPVFVRPVPPELLKALRYCELGTEIADLLS